MGKKKGQKKTKLGMQNKKLSQFAAWYPEAITKSEMIDYYDVSGCYILRPWSFKACLATIVMRRIVCCCCCYCCCLLL